MTDQEKLKDVRGQCRAAKDNYQTLETDFKNKEAVTLNLDLEVQRCDARISDHLEAKPQELDYPTDEEIQRWDKEYKRLVAARQKVVDKRREAVAARDIVRLKAIRAGQQLESLKWSER